MWKQLKLQPVLWMVVLAQIIALLILDHTLWSLLVALGINAWAIALFSNRFLASLPPPYDRPTWGAIFYIGATLLFIPILGPIGLVFAVRYALHRPKERIEYPYRLIEIPDLPLKSLYEDDDGAPRYSEGALAAVLRLAKDPNKRVAAVMALRQLPERRAMPILKLALKDPVDDVRLLAYSMIDRKDQGISARIQNTLAELDTTEDDATRFLLFRGLAQDYWELAYLGIAEGDVFEFSLQMARQNIDAALEIRDDVAGHYLKGRIALHQKDYGAARYAFELAMGMGLPQSTVRPYLAEVAFYEGHFSEVSEHLGEVPRRFLRQAPLSKVAAFWLSRRQGA